MKTTMKYRLKIIFGMIGVFFGLIGCAPNPKNEPSCNFVQNSYGRRISWKDQTPIPLFIHKDFPREFLPVLQTALKSWESVAGHRLFNIITTSYDGPLKVQKDSVSVIYWMKAWEGDKPSEQARTSIYWVGDQISEADMKINAKNFTYYINTPSQRNDVHLESLLIHELGHVLGLKHNDIEESVMATYLAVQVKRDHISENDQKSFKCEYL